MEPNERILTDDERAEAFTASGDWEDFWASLLAAQDAKTLRAVAGLLRGLRGKRCLCEAEDAAWGDMNHHPACVELRRMLAGAKEGA